MLKKHGTSILILLFISKKFTFNISWFLNIFNNSGATYLLASFFSVKSILLHIDRKYIAISIGICVKGLSLPLRFIFCHVLFPCPYIS